MVALVPFAAQAAEPIKIGVIAENSAISGIAIPNAAQIAADEINAAGGIDGRKVEIVAYDDHNSAADAVRALQRLASQDKVQAVIASYTSEVALALEPWAGRLKMPTITPGAASDEITKRVHDDYAHLKYMFQGYFASSFLAQSVCDSAKDLLVDGPLHVKTAAIFSEDAAWTVPLDATYAACLPKIGVNVLDTIRMSPDTTDFTPIYNGLEAKKPDVLIAGISHVGVQPTVQWANQQVPIPIYGVVSQATSTTFWNDTNGAADGVVLQNMATETVATTPKTVPFAQSYIKRYGISPAYPGYTTYDAVYYIAEAVKRAGSDEGDKVVEALEKTDWTGTVGQIKFYGKDDSHTHGMVYGPQAVSGLFVQWQAGKQVAVWPKAVAGGNALKFPAFVKAAAP
ncbi:ABC transporter substrate-binding protein [Lichenibacterium ramalinae]|nr:ABC transporter substrate-binding protein [Lichenibacterium ramalinae]